MVVVLVELKMQERVAPRPHSVQLMRRAVGEFTTAAERHPASSPRRVARVRGREQRLRR